MSSKTYSNKSQPYAPDAKTPFWVRAVGGRWLDGGTTRTWWGELSVGLSPIGISVGCYETAHLNVAAGLGQVFIRLPFLDRWADRGFEDNWRFGFAIHGGRDNMSDIHLNWGTKTKVVNFPWQERYLYREFYAADEAWHPIDSQRHSWTPEGEGVEPLTVTLPYGYLLRSGEVQRTQATVIRERYWKVWVWFGESGRRGRAPVSDFLRSLQRRLAPAIHSIDVTFAEGMGERAGSWKGGTTGCGWTMKPGESTERALSRMQSERKL